jgi:hypothetical protein
MRCDAAIVQVRINSPLPLRSDMMTTQNPSPAPKGADRAQEHLHTLTNDASAAVSELKEQGTQQFEQYRDKAADQLEGLVEGAQSVASAMEGRETLGLAQGISDVASGLGEFADRMRNKSAEELLQEGARLARQNPLLFLAGTVAVGFALSRFLRASADASDTSTSATADDGLGAMAPTPAQAYGATGAFETSVPASSAPVSGGLASDALVSRHETTVNPLPGGDPLGAPATYPTVDVDNDPILGDVSKKGGLV